MRVSFSLYAFSQQYHSGKIYIVWTACKEFGFQQIGICLQNPSLSSDLLCIVPMRIWPIFCTGSLEFFSVGHPVLKAGLQFLLLSSVTVFSGKSFYKMSEFLQRNTQYLEQISMTLLMSSGGSVGIISFFPENYDLLEFWSHIPENLH